MSGIRKRNGSDESSHVEDGLVILASMLADMLAGASQDRSHAAPEDPSIEVEDAQPSGPRSPGQS